jgi:hypothetical protein
MYLRFAILVFALGALLAVSAATADARPRGVRITSLTGHVAQGSLEHLNATVSRPSGKCSLTIRYANGTKQALGRKRVRSHRVAWTWRVPPSAAVGKARARVFCGRAGVRTGSFTVKKALMPASVVVTDSGLTQVPDGFDSGTDISYGVVLVNRSQDEDASQVEVDVNLLDAAGNAVASDSQLLPGGIPAGATFYLGGFVNTNDSTAVTHLSTIVKVAESLPRSLIVPAVTNVRLSSDDFDGSAVVDGDVTNEGTSTLSSFAEISAVFFNSAGKVIGGGFTFPPFDLPPGAQTAFEIDTSPGPQASAVSQVKVSVDPDYGSP